MILGAKVQSTYGGETSSSPNARYKPPGRFRRFLAQIHELTRSSYHQVNGEPDRVKTQEPEYVDNSSTTFTITPCDGGVLVTTKSFSSDFDVRQKRYIITNEENIGERLDTIFGFESIKKS